MSSDLDGTGLQAFLDAAGERYARRARAAELAKWRSPLTWLRWAWFGQDPVAPETVPLAAGRVFVVFPVEVPRGVALTGKPRNVMLPALEPLPRRLLRDSRLGRRARAHWR